MDTERSEDLNPASDDVTERVRQMLDPNLPDAPEPTPTPKKTISIQTSSDEVTPESTAPLLQTPKASKKVTVLHDEELPPPSAKKSKKVIIPIDHDQEESKPAKPKKSAVKKITIADHNDDPAAIAEKLDAAIADLQTGEPESSEGTLLIEHTEPAVSSAPELVEDEPVEEADAVDIEPPQEAATTEPEDEEPTLKLETPIGDLQESVVVDDPQIDQAVAEIVAAESDEILEIEDAVREQTSRAPIKQPKVKAAKKNRSGLRRAITKTVLLLLVMGIIAAAIVPNSRYAALNAAGVTSKTSMTIVDEQTDQPLKNAQVSIGNVSGVTNDKGVVTLDRLRLGKNQLTIQKSAFAPITKYITIGWGSNPLGQIGLSLTGTQYSFSVTDFLSAKPIGAVMASTTEADAVADDKGVIKLSLAQPGEQPIKVTLKRDGYRTQELTIKPTDKGDHPVTMVPSRKHVYVSKKSGKADIYTSYIDGKDAKVILAGSGKERDDTVLAPHPSDSVVAYVSTRVGQTNKAGETLYNLLILNLEDNNSTNVTAAEQVRIIGWAGDRLVYVRTSVDAKADATDRYRLVSYNYKDNTSKELAKTNFFNDVTSIGNTIYFALSSAYQGGSAGLYRVNADGTNSENVYNQEVWNVFRTAYDHLTLSVQQEWYDLQVGGKPFKLNAAPSEQLSRVYIDSPDGKRSARVDNRDGKVALLVYDKATKIEKEIQTQLGLSYPVRWINDNTLVYRVKTASETADYAVSLDGGKPLKISDVTNTTGLGRWLY